MKRIVTLIKYVAVIALGIFIGKNYFKETIPTVPLPSTMKYRYTDQSSKGTAEAVESAFSGKIIEVKKGGSIQKAV
jgi:hypothetical protein